MRINVIVNNFNGALTLEICIHSIRNQTYQDIEVYIIDKGSTDMSRTIAENMSKMDSRIKFGQDFNTSGKFVNFEINSRDRLAHLGFFENAMNHFIKYPAIGIVTGMIQSFNAKNEYLGSLGRINGYGERNVFAGGAQKDFTLTKSESVDRGTTFLPVPSSIVRDLSGDVLFIHETVLRMESDPIKVDSLKLVNRMQPVFKEEEIQAPIPIAHPVKKKRGRVKGSKNKPKVSNVPESIISQ